eukprot:6304905-Pyramimonas_sp.AAC.1
MGSKGPPSRPGRSQHLRAASRGAPGSLCVLGLRRRDRPGFFGGPVEANGDSGGLVRPAGTTWGGCLCAVRSLTIRRSILGSGCPKKREAEDIQYSNGGGASQSESGIIIA